MERYFAVARWDRYNSGCHGFPTRVEGGWGCKFSEQKHSIPWAKFYREQLLISLQIFVIYLGITIACALSYVAVGLTAFDAIVHSFTTVSTGGFSNYDNSFGNFSGPAEYVAIFFMIMAALPFVRYVQLANGNSRAIFTDTQIKTFLITTLSIAIFVFLFSTHYFQGIGKILCENHYLIKIMKRQKGS